jgi:hypothetical protein
MPPATVGDDDVVEIIQASSGNAPGSDSTSEPENLESGNTSTHHRSTQRVSTMSEKKKVVSWMMVEFERVGEDRMASTALATFPEVFRAIAGAASAGILKALLQKASRWWKKRTSLMEQFEKMPLIIFRVKRHVGKQRMCRKAISGRGRKRAAWETALLEYLSTEHDRLRKAGLKLDRTILKTICLGVLRDGKEGVYGLTMIVPGSASTMVSKITSGFINRFTDCRNCGTQVDWKTPVLGRENNSHGRGSGRPSWQIET